jgi:hypothetical protein
VGSGANLAVETLGTFIDERYAPWAREHVGDDAAVRLKADFAAWLSEPLTTLSAWRIESWRRDQLDSVAQPLIISHQLQRLDGCLSKAAEWQLIERNPLKDVTLDIDTDRIIELCGGGVGHGYLREGWARVEVNWTWTSGKRALLEWPPISGDADHVLKIHIAGVYKGSPQRLSVSVNDTLVGMVLCRGPAGYEFFVPAGVLNSRDRIDVVLDLPDACRPVDNGESADNRYLGLRVAKFEMRPIARSLQNLAIPAPAADDLPGVLEQRAALLDMAALGSNCEFGFVQRYVGAEPMNLFRWSSVPRDKLIAAVEKRFAGLTARDALEVKINANGEFVVEDKVYGTRHHTFVHAFQGGVLERVQKNEYVRVGVLCKALLEELRDHNKLFVYHDAGASEVADIRRLVQALRKYGNNTLLWIVGAPSVEQIGETRQIEPGLIRGFVSGFQTGPINPISPHLQSWVKVACRAHQIWTRAKDTQQKTRLKKQLQAAPKQ